MSQIFSQGVTQRRLSEEYQLGETLLFHRFYPALRKGVQIRAACCSSGMNEQDLQGHRCEHVFREIGGMFAKFSGSATILQREIYSQQPVYLPYTSTENF
jgi:hypothetical protein